MRAQRTLIGTAEHRSTVLKRVWFVGPVNKKLVRV